jgi:hypothetical protein
MADPKKTDDATDDDDATEADDAATTDMPSPRQAARARRTAKAEAKPAEQRQDETVAGGRYLDENGNAFDADGNPLDD